MAAQARPNCPDCATPMVPTLRGFACPRLASCGRGGVEETGARLRRGHARNPVGDRARA